ncbi:MAG TPA: acyl-ACP--UDP-N-acetylglucosamine O-acyltransferase [Candidatus Acidoferrum sp.]|nr:acyl-ACP--UDP-N-acetylglucosamine O-acyltransferase [Candidatus Acidoferrum sp.]
MIHPTAIVHPRAQLHPSVEVGPFAVIDGEVVIGPDCRIGPYVYLTGQTTIGRGNRFYAGCVIGEAPQDVKYKDEPARLEIGDDNLFREGFTAHRSAKAGEATVIGSHNFLMVNSHVGHNVRLGDHVILVNGALLAGHVEVADRAFISGNCMVHQFTRVGTLALMQGGAGISKDLPPFTIARGVNQLGGLNIVGLRRAGFTAAERLELKKLYHQLLRQRGDFSAALAEARQNFTSPPARTLLDFAASAKRGLCLDPGGLENEREADID